MSVLSPRVSCPKEGAHKSRAPGRPGFSILCGGARYFGVHCFMSTFWSLEFCGGSWVFGKFVLPCPMQPAGFRWYLIFGVYAGGLRAGLTLCSYRRNTSMKLLCMKMDSLRNSSLHNQCLI